MNEDDKDPDLQTWIDPELEARVVAWVLGETSAFETAELERIIADKPELAIFKRRIEAVHELAGAASRPPAVPLQLSTERRRKLLTMLGGVPAPKPKISMLRRPRMRLMGPWMLRAAACLVMGGIVALFVSRYAALEKFPVNRPAGIASTASPHREPGSMPQSPAQDDKSSGEIAIAKPTTRAPWWSGSLSTGWDSKASTVMTGSGQHAQVAVTGAFQYPAQSVAPLSTAQPVDGDTTDYAASGDISQQPLALTEDFRGDPHSGFETGSVTESLSRDDALAKRKADGPVGRLAMAQAQRSITPAKVEYGNRGSLVSDEGAITASSASDADHESQAYVGSGFAGGSALILPEGRPAAGTEISAGAMTVFETPSAAPAIISAPPANVPARSETTASKQPFSTFSLHVSDVSFQLARDALARGETPDPERIRPEEFYNALDYGDPAPAAAEEVACRIEQSASPFRQERNLVRIAIKVAATGRDANQPLRLTILLDTSGSMEREDRAAAVRQALASLASLLGPDDRVTLIGFARQPRLLAEEVAGDRADRLVEIAARTPSEGGTNLEEALRLAMELSEKHYLPSAQNRVVLLTDGAANLGDADPAKLAMLVRELRQRDIAFDACGVGSDGLNDSILEALTRKGDGRYYFLEKPEDADTGFARQLAGAFRPAAENVKVQVRWNPRRVGTYRLIGFEQHRLTKEDFRNDNVDAAELAAEEAGVALYEIEPLSSDTEGDGELGEVFVRFRDPATGAMIERSWTMPYDPQAPAFDRASPSMQLAGLAAVLAEKLRGAPGAAGMDLEPLTPILTGLRSAYPRQARVEELTRMWAQAPH